MNLHETAMFLLYVVAITLIVFSVIFSALWVIAAVLITVMAITLIEKIYFDIKLEVSDKKRRELIETISGNLDIFSNRLGELRADMNRNTFVIENRIIQERHNYEKEIDKKYREIAGKIIEIENRLSEMKRWFREDL